MGRKMRFGGQHGCARKDMRARPNLYLKFSLAGILHGYAKEHRGVMPNFWIDVLHNFWPCMEFRLVIGSELYSGLFLGLFAN